MKKTILYGTTAAVLTILLSWSLYKNFGISGLYSFWNTCYSAAATIGGYLYVKNRKFYFILKKLSFRLKGPTTFWRISIRCMGVRGDLNDRLFNDLVAKLNDEYKSTCQIYNQNRYGFSVSISERIPLGFTFERNGEDLFVGSDRDFMVPNYYADQATCEIFRFCDTVIKSFEADAISYGAVIMFDLDRLKKNPFFGLFTERIPSESLETFLVAYKPSTNSDSLVTIGMENITIRARNLFDLTRSITGVISYSAAPLEGA